MTNATIKNSFNNQLGQQDNVIPGRFGQVTHSQSQKPTPPSKAKIPHLHIAPAAGQDIHQFGNINQNPQEIEYLTYMMSQMEKTDKGREILTTLSKAGYAVALDYTSEGAGYCDLNTKTLFVRPTDPNGNRRTNSSILHTLHHEGEHGLQEVKGFFPGNFLYSQDLQSTLMIQRLSEAAADLAATDALFQIGGTTWEEEKSNTGIRPDLARTYEAAYNNTGDLNKARRACAKVWFTANDGALPKAYDQSLARNYEAVLKNGCNFGDDSKRYTTKSLADFYLKKSDGKPLFDDSALEFSFPAYSGISAETRTAMNSIYAARKQMFGTEPDCSLARIPTRPERQPAIQRKEPQLMQRHYLAAQIDGRS